MASFRGRSAGVTICRHSRRDSGRSAMVPLLSLVSWSPWQDPACPDAVVVQAIDALIVPRARAIGDFEARRALPAPKRQMVGQFIFFVTHRPVR